MALTCAPTIAWPLGSVTYPSSCETATCCALATGARKPISARTSKKIAALFLMSARTLAFHMVVNLFRLAATKPEATYGYETALDPGPDDIRRYRVYLLEDRSWASTALFRMSALAAPTGLHYTSKRLNWSRLSQFTISRGTGTCVPGGRSM
ncbi:hypothetical protein SBA6_1090014 [Candidatus Sulfopaludibacter sp. SbA6]|nr:hypothetical protein SBA6_1090014 [Candidatus Sulfopaludibacter sp. SbA6]